MLFIDIELTRDIKKNKERRRFDCFVKVEKKKNVSTFDEKKNEIDKF